MSNTSTSTSISKSTSTPTSFHHGELIAQDKAGTQGVAAELAAANRNTLNFSANHDAFVATQSFAVMSYVDLDSGCVWVTPLFGKEGDITAVTESEVVVSANCIPANDMLNFVQPETPLSLLGIDLKKRIRHRINGTASVMQDKGKIDLSFKVTEYAPNCPKYINRREIIYDANNADPINRSAPRQERTTITKADQTFIESMDTLWIGSYAPSVGADCNHRGGKPGFIRVTSPSTIEWPEYRGNGMFFTSGNLEVHDRAGVTLVDFETGSLIQMTGRAVVDWSHDGRYEVASRTIIFTVERLIHIPNVTSHRWKRLDYSPYNPTISGTQSLVGDNEYPKTATLVKIVEETENVKTFRFVVSRRISFLPGQYATFEFKNIPGGSVSEVRTWTLSETPNSISGDNTLDITVKRVPQGLVTNWLHDHAELGLEVTLNGIQGEMTAITLDADTQTPIVPKHLLLLSAGIGITPNLAMVRGIGTFSLQEQTNITMVHIERHEEDLISQQELLRRSKNYPNFSYTTIISSKQGRLTKESLQKLVLNSERQHAFICGPTLFMNDMTEHLVSIGVPAANIYTESFEF